MIQAKSFMQRIIESKSPLTQPYMLAEWAWDPSSLCVSEKIAERLHSYSSSNIFSCWITRDFTIMPSRMDLAGRLTASVHRSARQLIRALVI